MDTIQLGLRLAVLVLFIAKLVHFARDPSDIEISGRLRHWAWAMVSISVVFAFSPPNIAKLLGHGWPHPIAQGMRLVGLALLAVAAILWAAARGYGHGGTAASVRRGVIANVALVLLCLLATSILR